MQIYTHPLSLDLFESIRALNPLRVHSSVSPAAYVFLQMAGFPMQFRANRRQNRFCRSFRSWQLEGCHSCV